MICVIYVSQDEAPYRSAFTGGYHDRNIIIKKYRCLKHSQDELKFVQQVDVRTHRDFEASRMEIQAFYLRDDVSTVVPEKNTNTFRKVKKQRRVLTDSIKNLHLKFLAESSIKPSYSFFCKARPWWVAMATERDRETCQCIKYDNMQFMVHELFKLNVISDTNLEKISDSVVCYPLSKSCAY